MSIFGIVLGTGLAWIGLNILAAFLMYRHGSRTTYKGEK